MPHCREQYGQCVRTAEAGTPQPCAACVIRNLHPGYFGETSASPPNPPPRAFRHASDARSLSDAAAGIEFDQRLGVECRPGLPKRSYHLRLWYVVGLAFILLTFAFRTILVPVKSILGFLLSIAAALGTQVALFQWGWGASLLGVTKSAVSLSYLPTVLLAIIFGLSSDYEVFVVSRIKEYFTRTGDARAAVERGTGVSVRVVSAAALIMFSIFVAFMTTTTVEVRVIAFSFAVGVAIDAFVVRLTLVPAVMAIAGARLWYHPRWFAKYVPDPDIEGERLEARLATERMPAHAGIAPARD